MAMYEPNYRHNKSAEPTWLVGAANATYLAKTGGGTCATLNEVRTLLAVGAIAIVTDTQTLVLTSTTAADLITSNSFQIYYRDSAGTLRHTTMISRNARRAKTAAVAFVLRNQVIGGTLIAAMALPATIALGDVASVTITDRSYPHQNLVGNVEIYEVVATAADTFITLTNRLIALVNADAGRIANAVAIMDTTNVAGIRFTAIDNARIFEVGASGVLANAQRHWDGTTESSSPGQVGTNLYNKLRQYEQDAQVSSQGRVFTGTVDQSFWFAAPSVIDEMIPTKVDTAVGLTTYEISSANSGDMGGAQRAEGTRGNYLIAFVPATAVLTSFDTIAAVLFSTPSEQTIGG